MKTLLRKYQDIFFRFLSGASMGLVLAVFLLLLGTIFYRGMSSLSLEMLTSTTEGGYYMGGRGGVLNAIAGTLVLAFFATVIAGAVSVPVVFYLNLYLRRASRRALALRMVLDVLWGVPSIVYGAFGFILMVSLNMKASLLAGIVTVALVILPILVRSLDETVRPVPRELIEASRALGSTMYETATRVVLRQALPGIVTALLVAFGRAAGDAASVLFTAGYSDSMPGSPFRPVATLPLAIFFQIGTPFPEVQERGYASAFILTVLILLVSIAARIITHRWNRNVVK